VQNLIWCACLQPSRRDLELKLEKEGKSALSIEELKRLVK
jgi:hypothetical protein